MLIRNRAGLLGAIAVVSLISGTTWGATYYVDDDGPNDPGPNDPNVSDPQESGSVTHPFDEVGEAIDAASSGDLILVQPGVYFEYVSLLGKAITLASLQGPEVTLLDGNDAGRVLECSSGEGPDTIIDGFTICGGNAPTAAGMMNNGGSPTVMHCIFEDNEAGVGAGLQVRGGSSARIESCVFRGNRALSGGGGAACYEGATPLFLDCLFVENEGGGSAGVEFGLGTGARLVACRFVQNRCSSIVGGSATLDGGNTEYVNCVFSRNVATGAGRSVISLATESTFINCTLSHNEGVAMAKTASTGAAIAENCVFWGNSEGTFSDETSGPPTNFATVFNCNVEGGWTGPGSGNIDADPLFVQPGTDDVRLSFGSPCIDAGDNARVPGDITTDIDGVDRFLNGTVDMGAHEGEYDALPPAEAAYDIDPGDFATLFPDGATADFFNGRGIILVNTGTMENGTAVVTVLDEELYPTAVGYTSPGRVMCFETTLPASGFSALTTVPITADDLDGLDPSLVNLTVYVPSADSWALGVSQNTQNAAGDDDPIGERSVLDAPPMPPGIGAYGVVWDPQQQKGFVWANLDTAGDFAFGVPRCPSDCAQPPSGVTDSVDILSLFAEWGEGAGPFDVNNDEIVDALDLLGVLGAWGTCVE